MATVRVVVVAPLTLTQVVAPLVETCHCTVGVGEPEAAAVNLAVVLLETSRLTGWVVMTGLVSTVSVAELDVAAPTVLVKTARYWYPLSARVVTATLRVVRVAPLMLAQLEPALVESCHCTVGVGLPDAAAVKATVAPAVTVSLTGWVLTVGAYWTVNVAALEVADPALFVKTARYSLAFCAAVTFEIAYVVDVAPLMLAQVEPPLLDSCHCTDGVGLPDAVAVNVAAAPAFTV